jgi:dihydrofolate reductase
MMKKISIIVAMSKNRVIGLKNSLPWHISEDLKRFKRLTTGYPIIMGRKTFESIGKPLPERRNIVISRNQNLKVQDVEVVKSIEDALKICSSENLIYIIGGEQIYNLAMPYANNIHLTEVNKEVEGDAFFPEFDKKEWKEIARENSKDFNDTSYSFVEYIRS